MIKDTGFSRKLDTLCRLLLDKSIRIKFGIEAEAFLQFYVIKCENESIIEIIKNDIIKNDITLGVTRKVDKLERILVPREIRKKLNWNAGDVITILTDMEQKRIFLKKVKMHGEFERFLKPLNYIKYTLKIDNIFIKVNKNEFLSLERKEKNYKKIIVVENELEDIEDVYIYKVAGVKIYIEKKDILKTEEKLITFAFKVMNEFFD